MLHDVRFVPVRLRGYNVVLRCDVRYVVGYRAVCRCGARSKVTRQRAVLRAWGAEHRASCDASPTDSGAVHEPLEL